MPIKPHQFFTYNIALNFILISATFSSGTDGQDMTVINTETISNAVYEEQSKQNGYDSACTYRGYLLACVYTHCSIYFRLHLMTNCIMHDCDFSTVGLSR